MSRLKTQLVLIAIAAASLAIASPPIYAQPARAARPDALLTVDMNRSSIIEKISSQWAREFPTAKLAAFNTKLGALRADELLAVSFSGTLDGVLEVLAQSPATASTNARPAIGVAQNLYASRAELKTPNSVAIAARAGYSLPAIPAAQNSIISGEILENNVADKSKAVGEIEQDLVYTPVTPCRLLDTRTGQASALGTLGGVMTNQTTRTLAAGGKCGIPATGVRSIFLSFHAYTFNPSVLGVIAFQKTGAPVTGLSATWTGAVWATGTTISGTLDNGSFDVFVGNGAAMTADMVVDVVGYFQSANRSGDGLRVTRGLQGVNTINGAKENSAGGSGGTIAGGGNSLNPNAVSNDWATIGGGFTNVASGYGSLIAGGGNNIASGSYGTINGGANNIATGIYSTVAGGHINIASGANSFSAGKYANADSPGCAVFAFWAADYTFSCRSFSNIFRFGAENGLSVDFGVQATNGGGSKYVYIGGAFAGYDIITSSGANLTSAGIWLDKSDRAAKREFTPVNVSDVLRKVVALPLSTWSYLAEDANIRHMGPMAQDFRKAFGLGYDDKTMNNVDARGVAFAAIQGLNKKLEIEEAKSRAKDTKLSAQAERLTLLERELAVVKKKLGL
jgi:Chaperone of endosialidase